MNRSGENNMARYNVYSEYLKNKYGERVYKIPVNLPISCPNRDGERGNGGCIFCSEVGAAFENLPSSMCVKEQIEKNIQYIGEKYNAEKYIVYFQNFTNTYMPLDDFKSYISDAIREDVVAIYISTRPDCIRDEYLSFLDEIKKEHNVDITIEMGLQTVNFHTLLKINRGHTLAEFIDAVMSIKKYDFEICAHLILNLPWDNEDDVKESAKILSALRIDQVKLHCLYIAKNTPLAEIYQNGEFDMGSYYDYVSKVITFLRYLHPDIVIQRLIGRAKEEFTLFANYSTSWWKIKDAIENEMDFLDAYQGDKCDYLNGSACAKFFK